jgi:hypothetical protein
MITQDTLKGYAFPLIKVRYRGPTDHHSARWSASLDGRWLSASYDDGERTGAQSALPVAIELWSFMLMEHRVGTGGETADDFIFIPVDLGSDTYGFVPIAKSFFNNIDIPLVPGEYAGTLTNVRPVHR